MIKFIKILFFFAFALFWLAWGYRYYKCSILKECEPPVPVDSVALRKVTHTLFLLLDGKPTGEGYPEFVFNYGSAGATLLDEHENFLDYVTNTLERLPQHRLLLIGRCTQSEHKSNQRYELYENLGRARALTILDKLVLEHKINAQRIEIRGEVMADDVFFSPMQFIVHPHNANPYLEADISEDDLVTASDTLVIPEDDSLMPPPEHH